MDSTSAEIPQRATRFVKREVLREFHVEPVVDGERIWILASHLRHLMVPQRRQVQHLLFFDCHVIYRRLLQPREPLMVLLEVGIHADPLACAS